MLEFLFVCVPLEQLVDLFGTTVLVITKVLPTLSLIDHNAEQEKS